MTCRPMEWDCAEKGCFNLKKRLRFSAFEGCFYGNIGPTDIDFMTEVNGFFLVQEWKAAETGPLNQGQRIAFERLTMLSNRVLVIVVYGDPTYMRCEGWQTVYGGRYNVDYYVKQPFVELHRVVRKWNELVTSRDFPLPDKETPAWKAYVDDMMGTFVQGITVSQI